MLANVFTKLSGKGIKVAILFLAAIFALAPGVRGQTFTSGSDGSDGAYDLTGTTPGTIILFNPTQFHGTGVANNVFNFTTITIPSGITVRLSGSLINGPVYWLAEGNVDIEGTVDLRGQNAPPPAPILDVRRRAIPGPGGFAGGVGGKFDSAAIATSPVARPGDGPTGALAAGTTATGCPIFNGGFVGAYSGNAFLVPLVGGSGGGGENFVSGPGLLSSIPYGAGGGAGGGALLVASSTAVTVNGLITTDGGDGYWVTGNCNGSGVFAGSGAGGGGAIRLMAPTISGTGSLSALGGAVFRNSSAMFQSASGAIRLEAFQDNFQGNFNGSPTSMGSPFNTFIPAIGPPSVTVASVSGVNVAQPPSGSLATPDITINTSSAVSLAIQATNIPPGTVITLHVFSDNDTDQTVQTTPLLGTLQSSTATASVTFPSGFSLNYVKATWIQ
jgi:hypothetical protein